MCLSAITGFQLLMLASDNHCKRQSLVHPAAMPSHACRKEESARKFGKLSGTVDVLLAVAAGAPGTESAVALLPQAAATPETAPDSAVPAEAPAVQAAAAHAVVPAAQPATARTAAATAPPIANAPQTVQAACHAALQALSDHCGNNSEKLGMGKAMEIVLQPFSKHGKV